MQPIRHLQKIKNVAQNVTHHKIQVNLNFSLLSLIKNWQKIIRFDRVCTSACAAGTNLIVSYIPTHFHSNFICYLSHFACVSFETNISKYRIYFYLFSTLPKLHLINLDVYGVNILNTRHNHNNNTNANSSVNIPAVG